MDGKSMNIFVIGQSGTGKTPIAEKIAKEKNMNHIKGSEYFRESFQEQYEDRNEFTYQITQFSKNELKKNPYVNINYLKDKMNNAVVEGLRNPIDFTNLFKFGEDKVIYLDYQNNPLNKTDFEDGLNIIENLLNWSINTGIIKKEDFIKISFDDFFGKNSLEEQVEELLNGAL